MKSNKMIQWSVCATMVVLMLGAPAGANSINSIAASGGTGPSVFTIHNIDPSGEGWTIGDPNHPMAVHHDPNAGPWTKQLDTSGVSSDGEQDLPTTTIFRLHEHLQVYHGPAWTDWHEEILTSGWGWDDGTLALAPMMEVMRPDDTGFIPAPGLEIQIHGPALWFFFDPLPAGTLVNIWKDLVQLNTNTEGSGGSIKADGPFPSTIDVRQYPTIPTPAGWGAGAVLLGALGMFRRCRAG
ncbi:MAG: hypothetical protein CMJ49_07440 [Planctomycetaceae bacterium]|nr:hypothetical protein [Planctomycetaceae bacterium]